MTYLSAWIIHNILGMAGANMDKLTYAYAMLTEALDAQIFRPALLPV